MKYMQGFIFLFLLFTFIPPAFAVTIPTFPTCVNPQGTIKVTYSEGTHGIVGETATFTGEDRVFTLSEDALSQCFCSVDGDGIQTDWWKVSSLTEEEVDVLVSQGWQLVPNGALWGLEETSYLAKNSEYGCRPASQTQSATVVSSSVSDDPDDTDAETTGEVLAAATTTAGEVLGLADTGSAWKPLYLAATGSLLMLLGFWWARQSDDEK